MRFLTITLALSLLAASAVALDRDTSQQVQKSGEAGEVKKDAEKKVTKEKKSPDMATPL